MEGEEDETEELTDEEKADKLHNKLSATADEAINRWAETAPLETTSRWSMLMPRLASSTMSGLGWIKLRLSLSSRLSLSGLRGPYWGL